MPLISAHLLARERLLRRRARVEAARIARREPHRVHYFHQVDDPYSALASAALPQLVERYDIELVPHVVGPPADAAAPERARLVAYSRRDAELLARRWGLEFRDPGRQPAPDRVEVAQREGVAAIEDGCFVDSAGPLSSSLWRDAAGWGSPPSTARAASVASVALHRETSEALRARWGHYLGATFFYGGEWYWGLDRLYHLEQRLQALGAHRQGTHGLMYPPSVDVDCPTPVADPAAIDFYFSLRSPYSAIVATRVFELGRLTGAPVNLRYVLPMAMRGLPVPRNKRIYISQDAAREAHVRGIPFGRLNDPIGRPTERGLALIPLAERHQRGQAYVSSFMRAVWSEGIDAGADRGLRRIAERAGLPWNEAREAMSDEGWRATAEAHRAEMFDLGLWGVPSFRCRQLAVWGQDRLWAVQDELLRSGRVEPAPPGEALAPPSDLRTPCS